MSVGALRSSVVEPDVSDLLARARGIAVVARERAQQTETDRRVGDDMIERMRQADLFRVMQPRAYGGGGEWGGGGAPNHPRRPAGGGGPGGGGWCLSPPPLAPPPVSPWGGRRGVGGR